MPATSLFRIILIAGLVITLIGVIAGFTLSDTLPQALQDHLAQKSNADGEITNGEAISFIAALLLILILLPISTIGLWKFKSWARTLYVVLAVGFIPFYPVIGSVVRNGWEAMFIDTSLILEGVLLAMMFTGKVSEKFKPEPKE